MRSNQDQSGKCGNLAIGRWAVVLLLMLIFTGKVYGPYKFRDLTREKPKEYRANPMTRMPGDDKRQEISAYQQFETHGWFQWVHWWEANRSVYLKAPVPVQHDHPDASTPGSDDSAAEYEAYYQRQREKAVAGLLEATRAEESFVRGAAAIALGRMREASAVGRLIEMAEEDDLKARRDAMIGLGLIGNDKARVYLYRGVDGKCQEDVLAWIVAVGMLDDIPSEVYQRLLGYINQNRSSGIKRQAAWALRVQNYEGTLGLMREVLAESKDPYLASEAILMLGEHGGVDDADLLADIYLSRNRARLLPVIKNINSMLNYQWGMLSDSQRDSHVAAMYYRGAIRSAAAIGLTQLGRYDEKGATSKVRHSLANHFRVKQRIDRGRLTVHPQMELVHPHGRSLSARTGFEQRLACLALGVTGDEEEIENLYDCLRCEYIAKQATKRPYRMNYNPGRSFAAIGLGLYLRVMYDEDVLKKRKFRSEQKREQWQRWRKSENAKYTGELCRMIADKDEPLDFRAACALAVGLSANPENASLLMPAIGELMPGDEIVLGYTLLSLGMLGEQEMVKGAAKFIGRHDETRRCLLLDEKQERYHQPFTCLYYSRDVLARRATILGLGLNGSDQAGQVAMKAFGYDYFISQDVAWALRRCRNYALTSEMVEMLKITEAEGQVAAVLGAKCLGELFDDGGEKKLARLLAASNFTLPVSVDRPSGVLKEYERMEIPHDGYMRVYTIPIAARYPRFSSHFRFNLLADPMFLYRSYANEYLYFHMFGRMMGGYCR